MNTETTAQYSREEPDLDIYPECRDILAFWEGLRAGAVAPPWQSFDWSPVPSNIIPYCGVVDIRRDPLDFIYRFWGSAHVKAHGQELTGKSVKDMRPIAESESVFAQYRETLEAGRPLFFINLLHVGQARTPYKEVSLRLPFSSDGRNIDILFAFSDLRLNIEALVEEFEIDSEDRETA